jgi:DNA-binding MarR family transcriptional regulator
MSKKQKFISFINDLINDNNIDLNLVDPDIATYWETFTAIEEKEKPMFTDNGKLILKYLQDNQGTQLWKSRDIAEGLFVSSKLVSGSMRKLVSDGFVDKEGRDPVIYTLTEKGKTIEII